MKSSRKTYSGLLAQMERMEHRMLMSAALPAVPTLPSLSGITLPNLPSYSVPASNPSLPTGADTFSPPVGPQSLVAGVPAIATSNTAARSGDTLTLTGSAMTSNTAANFADTRVIVYGQTGLTNGNLTYGQVQTTSVNGVLVTIPRSEPANSMYLIWPENSAGIGAPVAVNQTQAQWISPGSPAPSSTVSVYGRNLDNGSGQSWVYLQPTTGTGQWVTVTNANPYRVQFTLPANFTAGSNYQVWVYNGHGGNYGWSTPLNLTVGAPQVWSTAVSVKAYGAMGNGISDDGPAIQMAFDSLMPNQTLYFPAGTYVVDGEQLLLPSNARIEGAGQNASTIRFDGDVPNIGLGAFEIGVRDFDYAGNIDIESLGLVYNGPTSSQGALVRERFSAGMTFNNVLLKANNLTSIDWENSSNLTLTNATVITNGLYMNGSQNIVMDNDLLLQAFDNYGQAGVTSSSTSYFSMTNCTTENYYDYELSLNPNTPYDANGFGEGRFMEFMGNNTDEYLAGNQSIDLGESATPADHNSGEQINFEGTLDKAFEQVISATNNTFTFAGRNSTDVIGLNATVGGGAGLGEQIQVIAASYDAGSDTTTYTLGKNFAVIPTLGSYVDIAEAPSNIVFYQNTLNHTTGQFAGQDEASTGIEFFQGGSNIVLDGNAVNNTRYGIRLWSCDVYCSVSSIDIVNNSLTGVQMGVSVQPDGRWDSNFDAVAIRNNTISGGAVSYHAMGAGIDLNSWDGQPVQAALVVFEANNVSGFPVGLRASQDPDCFADRNEFFLGAAGYGSSTGISFATQSSSMMLAGNTYSGYASAYSGNLPTALQPAALAATGQIFSDYQAPVIVQPTAPSVTTATSDSSTTASSISSTTNMTSADGSTQTQPTNSVPTSATQLGDVFADGGTTSAATNTVVQPFDPNMDDPQLTDATVTDMIFVADPTADSTNNFSGTSAVVGDITASTTSTQAAAFTFGFTASGSAAVSVHYTDYGNAKMEIQSRSEHSNLHYKVMPNTTTLTNANFTFDGMMGTSDHVPANTARSISGSFVDQTDTSVANDGVSIKRKISHSLIGQIEEATR